MSGELTSDVEQRFHHAASPFPPPMQPRDREKSKASEPPNDKDRRALLVAGEALISEKGFGRTTVEDVATQAKVSTAVMLRLPGRSAANRGAIKPG